MASVAIEITTCPVRIITFVSRPSQAVCSIAQAAKRRNKVYDLERGIAHSCLHRRGKERKMRRRRVVPRCTGLHHVRSRGRKGGERRNWAVVGAARLPGSVSHATGGERVYFGTPPRHPGVGQLISQSGRRERMRRVPLRESAPDSGDLYGRLGIKRAE